MPPCSRDLRYPSDLTDAEWAIVVAMILPGRHGGHRRTVNVREVLNEIFYVLWTGCQWKALPQYVFAAEGTWSLQIVKRSDAAGFELLP